METAGMPQKICLYNESELKSKDTRYCFSWLRYHTCEHLASFFTHGFWMLFDSGCILLKMGLGWLLCCLLLPNCSEAYERFQAQFLHLAQSWWQRVITFGWLPVQTFYPWANIWLQPRGKQLLELRVAVPGAGGFTADVTSLAGGAGGAYRVLSILVHPSLARLDLRVSACVKERGMKENRSEAESQPKEKNPVFCREAACCQRVTLKVSEGSDWPSGTAKSDEEARDVGNGLFCTSVLHLRLVLGEIKST